MHKKFKNKKPISECRANNNLLVVNKWRKLDQGASKNFK